MVVYFYFNMYNLFVIFTSIMVFVTINVPTVAAEDRIIGGIVAAIHDFPYQLSLHYRGIFHCGAVLITKNAAITAAHCVLKPYNTDYTVRAGSQRIDFDGIYVNIVRITKHPKFNSENDYDVAVLIFNRPICQDKTIIPIKLPRPNKNPKSGQIAVVSGWGSTHHRIEDFEERLLRTVNVKIIDQHVCEKNYEASDVITDRMICAGYTQGGKDACQGDSGGPLVSRGVLVGIVSWGFGCGLPDYPGVYTRISNPEILSFIKQYAGI